MKPGEVVWPCEVPEPVRTALLESAQIMRLTKDDHMLAGKDASNGLYYIMRGLVVLDVPVLVKATPWLVFKSRDWFGGSAVLGERSYQFQYRFSCIDHAEIMYIPDQVLRHVAALHPALYRLLYVVTSTTSNNIIESLFASSGMLLAQRVAFFLLAISSKFQNVAGATPKISISQTMLAHLLGLSRPKLNRQLHILEQGGMIALENRSIYILDAELLRSLLVP